MIFRATSAASTPFSANASRRDARTLTIANSAKTKNPFKSTSRRAMGIEPQFAEHPVSSLERYYGPPRQKRPCRVD